MGGVGHVPQLDGVVRSRCGEGAAVCGDRDSVEGVGAAGERGEQPRVGRIGGIPQLNVSVQVAGHEQTAGLVEDDDPSTKPKRAS